MSERFWSMHGLTIRCDDVNLDARPSPAGSTPDVTVRILGRGAVPSPQDRPAGRVLARIENGGVAWLSVVEAAESLSRRVVDIHFHGVATAQFDVADCVVDLVLADDADPAVVPILINGTIISVVLALLGHPVLHASAVAVNGRGRTEVIAFVGSSGMGKSTVATLACRDGARLFTDDVLRTDIVQDRVSAWPGATATRLRPAAAELARQTTESLDTTADGRTSAALVLAADHPQLLAALVVPLPDRESDAVRLERVEGIQAVLTLASYPRIMGWRDPATSAQAHHHWGELARRVPILLARIPWGPPFVPGLGAAVLDAISAEIV